MKTLKIIAALVFIASLAYSQNEVDALRYSRNVYGGTARFVSMGGAFGAVGGDLSALHINPAGIGVYRSSEFNFSPSFNIINTESSYMNSYTLDNKYNFNFNNIGIAGASLTGNKTGWISLNYAFTYNRMNSFNQNTLIQGINNDNSITDYFAEKANGKNYETFNYFNEGLAWDSYLIDPEDSTGNSYVSAYDNYGEIQTKSINSKGRISEYLFTLGANYDHKLYIGGSIGATGIRYHEDAEHEEVDPDTAITNFNSMSYKTNLFTRGTGFNFKFGLIFRPVNWIRIGGAIHSPSFYAMNDEYSSSIEAYFENDDSLEFYDNGEVLKSQEGKYSYRLNTPFKAIGNLAFIIKKMAIISFDYEYIDYSSARLRASDYSFITENNTIQTNYIQAHNFRAGIEYRYGPFSLRGGYAYYGNPYKTSEVDNDGTVTVYSGGIGIRDNGFYFDLGYSLAMSKESYYLYSPEVVPVEEAKMEVNSSRIITTFGFKF